MLFEKPALTTAEHISLLISRGLKVPDVSEAEHYLGNISYYRLSPYMLPFQIASGRGTHEFRLDTDFKDIMDLYSFDRGLRLLLLDPLERIEVALRAQLTNTLALNHGPHCLHDSSLFDDRYNHAWLLTTLQDKLQVGSAETFLKHYRSKYSSPELPPIWMALEVLSFKEVSTLFQYLRHRSDKQALVSHFGWPDTVLTSWFRTLSDLRNICAHHSRVWNRQFGSRPIIPVRKHLPADWPDIDSAISYEGMRLEGWARRSRVMIMFIVIESLMRNISPLSHWRDRLKSHLRSRSPYQLVAMGLEPGWEDQPFWTR